MSRNKLLMMAASLALAGGGMGSAGAGQPLTIENTRSHYDSMGLYGIRSPRTYGTKGAGISMAQQKRASKKRRNVQRHRASQRG